MERGGNRRSPSPVRRTTLLYLGTMSGILTLRRFQHGWRPLHCGLAGQPVPVLAVAPEQPEVAYIATGDTIYQTTDGGSRWRRVGAPRAGVPVTALLVGHRPGHRVLAGLRSGGIAYSDNQGATWRLATLPQPPPDAVRQLVPAGGEPAQACALIASLIWTSSDAGQTWRPLDTLRAPVGTLAVHPDAPATLYAGGPAGLFRTRNAGRSWQRLINQPVAAVLVHPARPRVLIAALPDGLHHSPNAGANWHPMSSELADDANPVVSLAGHAVGEVVLAVTRHGALLHLLDDQWRLPAVGPMPPVLAVGATSGEVAPWPGAPKRSQPRRRRPARREGPPAPSPAGAPADATPE